VLRRRTAEQYYVFVKQPSRDLRFFGSMRIRTCAAYHSKILSPSASAPPTPKGFSGRHTICRGSVRSADCTSTGDSVIRICRILRRSLSFIPWARETSTDDRHRGCRVRPDGVTCEPPSFPTNRPQRATAHSERSRARESRGTRRVRRSLPRDF